jgi:hypothetical protein
MTTVPAARAPAIPTTSMRCSSAEKTAASAHTSSTTSPFSSACQAVASMWLGSIVSRSRANWPTAPGSWRAPSPNDPRAADDRSIAYHGAHSAATSSAAPAMIALVRVSLMSW